ncbi:MAG: PIG-L family deacetylase [Candidatus Moranbacteria bacterium CG_4_9_14_3_um_filter_42_9]|nr:MAG: PIG-L family deacetylase [Candidatus Moranbacteria bacterium CG_4_9_14_3_um_filter_42_9]
MKNPVNFRNKKILVIGAHPDDNDFGAAATMALAAKLGAKIFYVIATKGQRGSNDKKMTGEKLAKIREQEQRKAAKILEIKEVIFLDYNDGELEVNLKLKEDLVMFLRKYRPDYVFTMDPSRFYYKRADFGFINHSDHRAIGEATLDACYPLARDAVSFSEHAKIGLKPHKVKEIFLFSFMPEEANCFIDVTKTLDLKIKALAAHQSQFGGSKTTREWVKSWAMELGKKNGFKYAEAFVRLKLR